MLSGHRGDLGVGCGGPAAGAIAIAHEASPYGGRTAVKRQDAPVELPGKVLLDPSLKSFSTLMLPYFPSASNEFCYGLSGKEQIRRVPGFDPVDHRLLGS